jgi:hypothetical protein
MQQFSIYCRKLQKQIVFPKGTVLFLFLYDDDDDYYYDYDKNSLCLYSDS